MMKRTCRDGERGFVLISVLVIAILYFALIMLILWESSMRYEAAQRFRSRVIAQTLAENAAELAARNLTTGGSPGVDEEIDDGLMLAEIEITGLGQDGEFHISAAGQSLGTRPAEASVEIWGTIRNGQISITRTRHSGTTTESATSQTDGVLP